MKDWLSDDGRVTPDRLRPHIAYRVILLFWDLFMRIDSSKCLSPSMNYEPTEKACSRSSPGVVMLQQHAVRTTHSLEHHVLMRLKHLHRAALYQSSVEMECVRLLCSGSKEET